MRGLCAVILLSLLLNPPVVLAQAATRRSSSASVATTHAAPGDQSSPKAALKSFARSLEAGDKQAIMRLLVTDSPQDKKLADAASDLAEATAHLRDAAVKTFGDTQSEALGNQPGGAD